MINKLYSLAVAEGEGFGTAYEYFVKSKKIRKITRSLKALKNIAVFGLPERHGFSFDFLFFSKNNNLNITVYDEREERINNLLKSLEKLEEEDNIDLRNNLKIVVKKNLADISDIGQFDMLLNSDVFQRFEYNVIEMMLIHLNKISKVSLFCMPNAYNINFVKGIDRRTIQPERILEYCKKNKINVLESGFIDMPPFPSGYAISSKKKEQLKNSMFLNIVFGGLVLWSFLESILPNFIKKKFSHIFYVIIK